MGPVLLPDSSIPGQSSPRSLLLSAVDLPAVLTSVESLQMALVYWMPTGKPFRVQPPQIILPLPQFIGNLFWASSHARGHPKGYPKICRLVAVPHTGQDQSVEGAVSISPEGPSNNQGSLRRTSTSCIITPIQQAPFPVPFIILLLTMLKTQELALPGRVGDGEGHQD